MDMTNSLMDFRTFARTVLGRQPGMMVGRDISEAEFESDKKAYDYYVKKGLDQAMSPEQLTSVSGGSFTNAEGRVTDYLVKPKGVDVQVLEPKTLATPGGTVTMTSPTNASPIYLPNGEIVQNYTSADAMYGGAPAPLAGGGMMATNAPVAAPVQTPDPSPTPIPEGAVIRSKRDGKNYRIVNGQPVLVGP
jgi:hypothetical protein